MTKLERRDFIQTLGAACASAVALVASPRSQKEHDRSLNARESTEFIEIDNRMVKARFRKEATGIDQEYFARKADGGWEVLVKSLRPPNPRPEGTSPLYSDVNVAREYRLLVADALKTATIVKKTDQEVTVALSGTLGKNIIEQSISLAPGWDHIHVEVRATLAEPRLEYLLSPFVFAGGPSPDFTHVPCLKRAPDDVIGDRIFDSPAVIIQKQHLLAALVPDLDLLNREVVYAKGARPVDGPRGFRIPQDPAKISMPAILDLELKSGLTASPLFSFGLADYITEQHVFWRHENKSGAMVRELSKNRLHYGFDLILRADAPLYRGYQRVSRHLWQRYGSRYYRRPRPQAMPLAEYAKVCYSSAFSYKGDSRQDTDRYSKELPYDSVDSGPLPTWLEFNLDGQPVGGIRATPTQWYYDIQFSPWWNNVRDAVGMYWWGKQGDPTLVDKARRMVNLALAAPQKQGIFPSVYRYNEKRWVGCYWRFPDNFNPNWPFPETWKPKALPHFWDFSSDYYQTAAASKTGVYLLRYQRLCENDPRIVPYLRRYGDFLVEHIDPNGCIPATFTKDLNPNPELRFNAEGGMHIWFLSELHEATQEKIYLEAAERIAAFLIKEILPQQRWYDFETFYSCSIKPESFFDGFTGQWPQCTLSMLWAIDGFAGLYKATKKQTHLAAAEAVADYAAFYQAGWQPHFVITAYAFGGYRSQNSDAEWLDMRQTCFADAFARLAELTHRQDLYERGVSAMRASFAVINHPRHIKNEIFPYPRYPLGIEPENIDHEGLPQDPLRSGFDWGEGGGLAAAAELLNILGGAYIDFDHKIAVGVDGVYVKRFRLEGNQVEVELENQLAALPFPYDLPFPIKLRIPGLPAGRYELVLNGQSPRTVSAEELTRLDVEVKPSK